MNWNPKTIVIALLMLVAVTATAVFADEEKNAKKRAEMDAVAAEAVKAVTSKSETAKELYAKAVGYAVFDNLKIQFGISGGGGSGVAVPKKGNRTYMKMGTGGIGFGIGAQKYQVVFLFENEKTMKNFIDKGWQADASAQAAAGEKGANLGASFVNGIAVYQVTEKGLIASADITGTKYWKDDDLNKTEKKEEEKEKAEKE